MVNYKTAKLYKITFPGGEECIGTTTKTYLSQRRAHLNYVYRQRKLLPKTIDSVEEFHQLMDKYGTESYTIVLLDNITCRDKDELNAHKIEYALEYIKF